MPTLAYAAGGPLGRALFRVQPEDFVVQEYLGFEPSGEGEHLFLRVRKRLLTTDNVAGLLAKAAGLPRGQVGYAGMKDKHAVTEQWFSLQCPTHTPVQLGPLAEGVEVIELTRNNRKLRRGALAGNRFRLHLREVDVPARVLSARLAWLAHQGVPNYFGEQRFGRDGDNVAQAQAFFAGRFRPRSRNLRGILLSAARSHIYNRVLSERVADGSWRRILPGELVALDGRGSVFAAEQSSPELERRLAALAIHPTGPLPGDGGSLPGGQVAELEAAILGEESELVEGLVANRVEAARRALRLRVAELRWHFPQPGELVLGFSLAAGAYATTVLREVLDVRQP